MATRRFDWITELDKLLDESGMRLQFWICPEEGHPRVEWTGDVARCLTCGRTNKDADGAA